MTSLTSDELQKDIWYIYLEHRDLDSPPPPFSGRPCRTVKSFMDDHIFSFFFRFRNHNPRESRNPGISLRAQCPPWMGVWPWDVRPRQSDEGHHLAAGKHGSGQECQSCTWRWKSNIHTRNWRLEVRFLFLMYWLKWSKFLFIFYMVTFNFICNLQVINVCLVLMTSVLW